MMIKHIRINGFLQVEDNINMGMLKELLAQYNCYFLGYMEDNAKYSTEEFLEIVNSKLEDE